MIYTIIDVSDNQSKLMIPNKYDMSSPHAILSEYSKIDISFEVRSIFEPILLDNGLGGIQFVERAVEPYIKDYNSEELPTSWAKEWDLSKWVFLLAFHEDQLVGGAVLAYNTKGVNMLKGRADLTILWDIRVNPSYRAQGLGRQLVEGAISWAKERHCTELVVETQNINVPACCFYVHMGFQLSALNIHAYKECPGEVQLIWHQLLDGLS